MNVSGDVCDEVVVRCLMSKPFCISIKARECQDAQTSSWCQRLCVLSGVRPGSKSKFGFSGRDAGHCFGVLDPAKLPDCGNGQT